MGSYMGHTISCDTSLVSGVQSTFNNAGTTIQSKASEIKSELQALIDYAYSDPSVGTSLQATAVDNAVEAVNEAISTALSQLNNIINSISDYSDGNWSDANNKLFLDNFLGIKQPSGGGGGGGGGGGSDATPSGGGTSTDNLPSINDEILDISVSDIVVNPYTDTPTSPTTDVELISQQAEISQGYFVPGGFSTTVSSGNGEFLESSESNITTETISPGQLSSSASSIGSNFDFSIPSPTIGNVNGIKSSGVIGTIGLAAAAALALGGKVAYDRNAEKSNINSETSENIDEDDDEDDNEDINKTHIQTGADVINEVDSNIVKFKEEILKIGLDNDTE